MAITSALVDDTTFIVVNIIMADPAVDPAPPGYLLIGLQSGMSCQIGDIYDPVTNTFSPPPPLPVKVPYALVDDTTLIVVGIIMADPAVAPAPPGYLLIKLQPGDDCQIGYVYDPVTNTFSPPVEPVTDTSAPPPVEVP